MITYTAESAKIDGNIWTRSSSWIPNFLPLNFKRLNAKAEAAPITTEKIATTDEMIKEFFTHDKNGILGEEKSIL